MKKNKNTAKPSGPSSLLETIMHQTPEMEQVVADRRPGINELIEQVGQLLEEAGVTAYAVSILMPAPEISLGEGHRPVLVSSQVKVNSMPELTVLGHSAVVSMNHEAARIHALYVATAPDTLAFNTKPGLA